MSDVYYRSREPRAYALRPGQRGPFDDAEESSPNFGSHRAAFPAALARGSTPSASRGHDVVATAKTRPAESHRPCRETHHGTAGPTCAQDIDAIRATGRSERPDCGSWHNRRQTRAHLLNVRQDVQLQEQPDSARSRASRCAPVRVQSVLEAVCEQGRS